MKNSMDKKCMNCLQGKYHYNLTFNSSCKSKIITTIYYTNSRLYFPLILRFHLSKHNQHYSINLEYTTSNNTTFTKRCLFMAVPYLKNTSINSYKKNQLQNKEISTTTENH